MAFAPLFQETGWPLARPKAHYYTPRKRLPPASTVSRSRKRDHEPGACSRSPGGIVATASSFQPLNLLWRKLDIECRKAVFQFGDRARPDQRDDRKRLGNDVSERDMYRAAAELVCKL